MDERPAGRARRDRKDNGVTREIVALSTRYGLISRETSFVAIERRETPVEEDIQLRKVPIALAAGWGGLDQPETVAKNDRRHCDAARGGAVRPGAVSRMHFAFFAELADRAPLEMHDVPDDADFDEAESPHGAPEPPREQFVEDPLREQMMALIMLQRANGSWEMSSQLEQVIGSDAFRPGPRTADATPLLRDFATYGRPRSRSHGSSGTPIICSPSGEWSPTRAGTGCTTLSARSATASGGCTRRRESSEANKTDRPRGRCQPRTGNCRDPQRRRLQSAVRPSRGPEGSAGRLPRRNGGIPAGAARRSAIRAARRQDRHHRRERHGPQRRPSHGG